MIPAPEKFVQAVSNAHEISISETLMECPFCKEIIKRDAIKCKHCGSLLREIDIQENMQTTENLEIKQEIPKTDLPDNKPEETELKENK
jgi:phage FluMu protein Com